MWYRVTVPHSFPLNKPATEWKMATGIQELEITQKEEKVYD